ncbi:hypothetical protein CDAR_21891 [Caerostris darwini]|uniref:Uncharacterized protein n=1 Tax=Caerostris darwini TaxID=1538125 RepID=A0AAV4VW39_9ARAC|nr:hypothetical protein CDAR_21891 [Caerostris darwini]
MAVKCNEHRHHLQSQQSAKVQFTVSHDERFPNDFTMWNGAIHSGGPRNPLPSPSRFDAISLGGGGRAPLVIPEQEEVWAPPLGWKDGNEFCCEHRKKVRIPRDETGEKFERYRKD